MRATDIIRNVLDLIDNIECEKNAQDISIVEPVGDDERRVQQVVDFLSQSYKMYDNSPAEIVAGIESVTTNAGGGLNGPKNPADIRADSISMYPNYQHRPE